MAEAKAQHSEIAIRGAIGDISELEVFHNQVLVGIYIRPEKTQGGIILTANTLDEDKWQGKVGVVLKKGPLAFQNDGANDFRGQDVQEGDWIVYRVSDGFAIDVNKTHCRLIEDIHVRARVPDPTLIY